MIKYNFYRYKFGLILGLLSLLLVACGSDSGSVTASENIDDDAKISTDYKNEIDANINIYLKYLDNLNISDTIKLKEDSLNYISYTTINRANPRSSIDNKIHSQYVTFVIASELVAENYIEYVNSGDEMYKRLAKDFINDSSIELEKLSVLGEEYGN